MTLRGTSYVPVAITAFPYDVRGNVRRTGRPHDHFV
jgi:hypothetical protein